MKKTDPMRLPPRIKVVAKRIAAAANTAIDAYAREAIKDEPSITDRWIGAVVGALSSQPAGFGRGASSIQWEAKTLRSTKGVGAEEKVHGADILGVAEIHIGKDVIRKGFLGQAKRTEPGETLTNARWDELQAQARRMLERSPVSYILVYSKRQGIQFIPAIAVANCGRRDLFDFNCLPLEQFFQWHLACFIGDHRLDKPHIDKLEALREFPIGRVLYITIRTEGPR